MLTYILSGTLIALITGVVFKVVLGRRGNRDLKVSGLELVIGTILCAAVVAPSVTAIGFSMSRTAAVTYNEYWGGLEETATPKPVTCTKDGSCRHTYDCDVYQVLVTKTRTVSDGVDSKGNPKTKTETYTEWEDRYHQCPYVTTETTYVVTDTIGETYVKGQSWFPENPSQHRWTGSGYNKPRFGFGAPGLPNVPSGVPAEWAAAKARIDADNPGGTAVRKTYRSPLLASDLDIYAKTSSAIDGYVKAGQMPKVVTEIHDDYLADFVYYVGDAPAGTDKADWLTAIMRFNGYLGYPQQGNLHLVLVTDPSITDASQYSQALAAYWQSEAVGKNALSKNGIGLVVGVGEDGNVSWARGFTGMPAGNEALMSSLRDDLDGLPATPDALLDHTDGAVAKILLGDDGFKRVEMADYEYLFETIEPGPLAKSLILLIGALIAAAIWTGFAFLPIALPQRWVDSVRHARATGQALPGDDLDDLDDLDAHVRYRDDRYSDDFTSRF